MNIELITTLIESKEKDSFYKLIDMANDKNLQPDIFNLLSEHPNNLIKEALAGNPNITNQAALNLAKDINIKVKFKLALNLNVTNKAALILARDISKDIKFALSINPNINENVMVILAKDEDWQVRAFLTLNPNITDEIKKNLEDDKIFKVRELIKKDGISKKTNLQIYNFLVSNLAVPQSISTHINACNKFIDSL